MSKKLTKELNRISRELNKMSKTAIEIKDKNYMLNVAEIFVQYLIGSRNDAVRRFKGYADEDFIEVPEPGSAEYKRTYQRLYDRIVKAIKDA